LVPKSLAVTLERGGDGHRIRLTRGSGNAINGEVVDGLIDAFREAEADDGCRGVLFCSSGRLFCPGLDLRALSALDRDGMRGFMRRFRACNLVMYTFSKPMVAALHGHTLAGGLVLALAADWRLLRRGALVGLNELMVGVPLPFGTSLMLREAVIASKREEVALMGRNYSDDAALESSLVHELYDGADFEAHCLERLREMSSKDPAAFTITKRYLRSSTVERIRSHDARFLEEFLDCWFSDSTQERIRTIVERLDSRNRPGGDAGEEIP